MSLCDPQIEGIPKNAKTTDFSISCNSLFSKNSKINLLSKVVEDWADQVGGGGGWRPYVLR